MPLNGLRRSLSTNPFKAQLVALKAEPRSPHLESKAAAYLDALG
jgi:hypothetical protein